MRPQKHTSMNSQGAFMWSTRRAGSMCGVRCHCTWQQRWHQSEGPPSWAAMRWIGYEPRCTPYWPHSLLWGPAQSLPEYIIDAWRLRFCLAMQKKGQLKNSWKKE